jgi:hypothetical protein
VTVQGRWGQILPVKAGEPVERLSGIAAMVKHIQDVHQTRSADPLIRRGARYGACHEDL